jgi:hypothetical protein
MSDKTPGERAFEKFFEMMGHSLNLAWAEASPKYKAAWEAAAEEGYVAHIDRILTTTRSMLAEYGNGFAVTHSKPVEAKPEIDWLAINKSCS